MPAFLKVPNGSKCPLKNWLAEPSKLVASKFARKMNEVPPLIEWFAEWKVVSQLQLARLAKRAISLPLIQTVAQQVLVLQR